MPDDNFEQALINLGFDDILDDYVQTNNISSIDSINLNNMDINDLTGINDFSSLTQLYCDSNNLISLDVAQNDTLYLVSCNDNNLSSLEVPSSLTTLLCANNSLINLNLESEFMFSLIANNNNLENLTMWSVPWFFLSLNNNNLSTLNLNVGSGSGLEGFCLPSFLDCRNNPLTCIQVCSEAYAASQEITILADWKIEIAGFGDILDPTELSWDFWWMKDGDDEWSIDCDTGLPCGSEMEELIDKSGYDGKIYNLLGEEINRREGIYIEGGEIKYRFQ